MVKRLGHLQRMALGQRITVQGQQRLLVQAELLHLRGGEGGVNRLDGNPAQPEGPGRLPRIQQLTNSTFISVSPFLSCFSSMGILA